MPWVMCDHQHTANLCHFTPLQVEALLEELRAAYCETRKAHCGSGWTEEVLEADGRRYHMGRLTVSRHLYIYINNIGFNKTPAW